MNLVFILSLIFATTESYNPYRGRGSVRRGYGRAGPPAGHKERMEKLRLERLEQMKARQMKRGLTRAGGSKAALEKLKADIQANPQKLQQALMNGMTPQFLSQG